jgi:DNA-binding transcriptional LysR family regulator
MNIKDIDLNLLRVFDVLMEERSVTRAADVLNRTQSAVSHSLGKLRVLFEDELFTRNAGEMRPTPRAIELAADISLALANIHATISRHQHFDPALTQRNFRIGLSDYDTMIFIPGLLEKFSQHAPNATFNIIPTSSAEVGALLHSRQLDCAIIAKLEWDDPTLVRIDLGNDRLVCAVWSGSPLARSRMTIENYLAATHLQISADGRSTSLVDIALKQLGMKRKVSATIPTYLLISHVLRGTSYITHCGDSIVIVLDENSEVTLMPPPLSIPDIVISLIFNRQFQTDPATIWLRQIIVEIFEEWKQKKNAWRQTPCGRSHDSHS